MYNPAIENMPLEALRHKNTIGISMKISLQTAGAIPRSQGGKLKRVVDNRVLD